MSEIRIMKRGKVYQYRFEIASRGGVRRYIIKSGFTSRKEAQEAGAIAYNEYFRTGRKQKIKEMPQMPNDRPNNKDENDFHQRKQNNNQNSNNTDTTSEIN